MPPGRCMMMTGVWGLFEALRRNKMGEGGDGEKRIRKKSPFEKWKS